MYFPTLFDSPAARVSAFVDFGNVFADSANFDAERTARLGRYRPAVARAGRPDLDQLRDPAAQAKTSDEIERLQFTFGGAF